MRTREVCDAVASGEIGERTGARRILRRWSLETAWGLFFRIAIILAAMVALSAYLARRGEGNVCEEFPAACAMWSRCAWCPLLPHDRRLREVAWAGK